LNIFAISHSPVTCASALDDKRLIKMTLETAQLLCSALYKHGYHDVPYRPTHINHPCTNWAAETRENWEWLFAYLSALNSEYRMRFNKELDHKSYSVIADNNLQAIANSLLPSSGITEFANCSGFKELPVLHAYKECLKKKWLGDISQPRWTNTTPPEWWG
jgi:hypothetical protein